MGIRYFLIGATDDVTKCDCCGKENLKRTAILGHYDDAGNQVFDEPMFFGSTCAEKALEYGLKTWQSKLVKEIKSEIALTKKGIKTISIREGDTHWRIRVNGNFVDYAQYDVYSTTKEKTLELLTNYYHGQDKDTLIGYVNKRLH